MKKEEPDYSLACSNCSNAFYPRQINVFFLHLHMQESPQNTIMPAAHLSAGGVQCAAVERMGTVMASGRLCWPGLC